MRPEKRGGKTALLIIDMLNKLDFPEGKRLLPRALKAAGKIACLKKRAREKNIPVIYVNDNFGQWRSDQVELFALCTGPGSRGRALALELPPADSDYFVLKPRHSGFFETPLDTLLNELKVNRLVLTGIAGNLCVLFTAHDAHMRGYEVIVPGDCIASNHEKDNRFALRQLGEVLGIRTTPSGRLRL